MLLAASEIVIHWLLVLSGAVESRATLRRTDGARLLAHRGTVVAISPPSARQLRQRQRARAPLLLAFAASGLRAGPTRGSRISSSAPTCRDLLAARTDILIALHDARPRHLVGIVRAVADLALDRALRRPRRGFPAPTVSRQVAREAPSHTEGHTAEAEAPAGTGGDDASGDRRSLVVRLPARGRAHLPSLSLRRSTRRRDGEGRDGDMAATALPADEGHASREHLSGCPPAASCAARPSSTRCCARRGDQPLDVERSAAGQRCSRTARRTPATRLRAHLFILEEQGGELHLMDESEGSPAG